MDSLFTWALGHLLSSVLGVDPFDPLESSAYVDRQFPELGGFIVDLCLVESGGCRRAKGVHSNDGHWGALAYHKALRHGRLSEACYFHDPPADADSAWWAGWSTTGNHGLMTAHNLWRLGTCLPQQTFRVPLFSAFAAALKSEAYCSVVKRRFPGVACDHQVLRCHWAGTRKSCDEVWQRWQDRLAKHYAYHEDRLAALER